MRLVVGITGSLGSGKTEVARLLKAKGARVFDADLAARKALRKGEPAYQAVVKLFGRSFLKENGDIDRKKLAARVFSDPKELRQLNTLIHPGVIFDCLGQISRLRREGGVLALDVPLLFESRMDCLADLVVVVTAPEALVIRRAVRNGLAAPLVRRILASQWPAAKKAKRADIVIRNTGSLAELKKKVSELWLHIKRFSTKTGVVRPRSPLTGE